MNNIGFGTTNIIKKLSRIIFCKIIYQKTYQGFYNIPANNDIWAIEALIEL